MAPWLIHYLANWPLIIYGLAFLGMIIEGDIFLFVLAFLVHQGVVAIWPSTLIAYVGALLGDSLWYYLGRRLNNHPWGWVRWLERVAAPLDQLIRHRPRRALFLTKFTYGVHRAVILRLGALNFRWRSFIRNDAWAVAVWILVIGGVGYFFGYSATLAHHYVRYGELVLLVGLVLLINFERLLGYLAHWRPAPDRHD